MTTTTATRSPPSGRGVALFSFCRANQLKSQMIKSGPNDPHLWWPRAHKSSSIEHTGGSDGNQNSSLLAVFTKEYTKTKYVPQHFQYCLEADIVRQKVKISYQIKNKNWRFSCTKGLWTIQMAFVALKALKWALKGQELASDTLIILLANAYHWNPCWKVDEHCHISGCLRFTSTKV